MGYGASGAGGAIPGGATLNFDVGRFLHYFHELDKLSFFSSRFLFHNKNE